MFAASTLPISSQSISSLSLSQIQSVTNAVRSFVRTRHHASSKKLSSTAGLTEESDNLDVSLSNANKGSAISDEIQQSLATQHLELNILLHPLTTHQCNSHIQPHSHNNNWTESFTSKDTFFQNKYGFSEKELWMSTYGDQPLPLKPLKTTLLSPLYNHPISSQTRTFKTYRSDAITGFGTDKKTDEPSTLKKVRLRLSGEKRVPRSEKLKNMVNSFESAPEVQEKLKVAFAEGYSASDGKGATEDTLFRRLLRAALFGVALYLGYVVLLKFNEVKHALKGEVFRVSPENTGVSFDDVKGADEAKQELKDIVSFLKDPERFEAIGAKLPKGVLLVGPPGIGKTLLARAVAGEAKVPFFYASGSDFDEMLVGMGAKRVRNLFDVAKMHSPCIIFIDEIDSVGSKRTESNIHPYANQTINQLLSEMDGYSPNEGVIVLGATNRRQTLDKALLRPGRFDMEVLIYPPDMKGRIEIFKHYLAKVKFDESVDPEGLAKGTRGFSGAQIENMVNQAALQAVLDGTAVVKSDHLEYARDKIIMGPAKKQRIPDQETNIATAYHEAGHTLVAYFTEDATPLHKVTIIPRGMSLGHTSFMPDKEQYQQTKSQLIAAMDVAMGGRIAEEMMFGAEKVSTGAGDDFQQATAIATAMVKTYGMSERVGVRVFNQEMVPTLYGTSVPTSTSTSPATAELLDNEIKRYLNESYERASKILKSHTRELKAISKALMKYDTLNVDEVKDIIENRDANLATDS